METCDGRRKIIPLRSPYIQGFVLRLLQADILLDENMTRCVIATERVPRRIRSHPMISADGLSKAPISNTLSISVSLARRVSSRFHPARLAILIVDSSV